MLVAIGWFLRTLVGFHSEQPKGAVVKVPCVREATAEVADFNPVTEYVGHLEPVEATDILPQVEGYIHRVCFAEGSFVNAGDLLFEIDVERYEAARDLRCSEIRSAESKVVVARSEVERAERYFKRLVATDNRGVTATDRDTAETTLASAKAAFSAAQAAVEQAKASAAIADFNLKHTKVFSPIAGRIGKAFHHVGDYVSPAKSALARVVRLDPIRVVFPVTDRNYAVWASTAGKNRRLRLRLTDGSIYGVEGVVGFCNNEFSRETGTLVLYSDFANPHERLLPNVYVRVLVDLKLSPKELVIPESAIELHGHARRVWKIGTNNVVRPVEIEVGASFDGMTMVKRGLEAGERVVSAGMFKLTDGCQVEVER